MDNAKALCIGMHIRIGLRLFYRVGDVSPIRHLYSSVATASPAHEDFRSWMLQSENSWSALKVLLEETVAAEAQTLWACFVTHLRHLQYRFVLLRLCVPCSQVCFRSPSEARSPLPHPSIEFFPGCAGNIVFRGLLGRVLMLLQPPPHTLSLRHRYLCSLWPDGRFG